MADWPIWSSGLLEGRFLLTIRGIRQRAIPDLTKSMLQERNLEPHQNVVEKKKNGMANGRSTPEVKAVPALMESRRDYIEM